eukprot:693051-Prorocentrum_minimum.AAC.4
MGWSRAAGRDSLQSIAPSDRERDQYVRNANERAAHVAASVAFGGQVSTWSRQSRFAAVSIRAYCRKTKVHTGRRDRNGAREWDACKPICVASLSLDSDNNRT